MLRRQAVALGPRGALARASGGPKLKTPLDDLAIERRSGRRRRVERFGRHAAGEARDSD
jgi:hypothetical protein